MSTPKSRPVDQAVLEVLADGVSTEGNALKITRQLDRALYAAVNKVLEAAGGKWDRKAKAHLFPGDAADAMEQIVLTGQIALPQDFGQFFTPDALARRVVDLADIMLGHEVLEPSAGTGVLATHAHNAGGFVTCVEIDPKLCAALSSEFHALINADFIDFADSMIPPDKRFDRVVMNPPFAKRADVHHITKAHSLLKPGGKLVAIASAAVEFRDDKLGRAFRDLVAAHNGTIEALPPGSFKESGTMVNTVIVTMDGPHG